MPSLLNRMLLGEDASSVVSSVLNEGALDKETTELSRWLVKEIKKLLKSKGREFKEVLRREYKTKWFKVAFLANVHKEDRYYALGVDGVSVAGTKPKLISITIQLPGSFPVQVRTRPAKKGWLPPTWENLIGQLKNLIRHELEHLTQTSSSYLPNLAEPQGVVSYYSSPKEVAAYVSGIYKQAKAQKAPFFYLLTRRLDAIKDEILRTAKGTRELENLNRKWIADQVRKIQDLWFSYAEKRYPKAAGIGDTELIPRKYRRKRMQFAARGQRESVSEAEYQGKKVKLNKIMRSENPNKKFKVYVRDGETVKKVEFGDPSMTIKKHIPARRKSFRARHRCDDPGPETKPRYWACKTW